MTAYRSAENQSYAQIFQPMGRLHTFAQRISSAVLHNVGVLG